jgi:hypothetical protein
MCDILPPYTGLPTGQFFRVHSRLVAIVETMKSAFELAMSRLEKESPTLKLTEEQKLRIAEIDTEITAKIAERKVFLDEQLKKSAGDPETQEQLRKQLAGDIARLEEKREEKKKRVRDGAAD